MLLQQFPLDSWTGNFQDVLIGNDICGIQMDFEGLAELFTVGMAGGFCRIARTNINAQYGWKLMGVKDHLHNL